jgi:hypothetical protein
VKGTHGCVAQLDRAIRFGRIGYGFESCHARMITKYKKPTWAVNQIIRDDWGGIVEDICEHGIGHPNKEWLKKHGKECDNIHGCDGCCSQE